MFLLSYARIAVHIHIDTAIFLERRFHLNIKINFHVFPTRPRDYSLILLQSSCPLILVPQSSFPLRSTHQQYPVNFWHCTLLKLPSLLHSGEKTMAKSADHTLA